MTLNNKEEAVLRGVATCCFVLLKNLMILHNLGANFPIVLPLIHHFTPNPNMAQATLVHLTLPPSGTSICYLSGEAILQAILAIPPRSCSTADLISHLNLELIELAWHLSLIQKGHAVMPGTQVRGVRWN